jgi:hypothetical protein
MRRNSKGFDADLFPQSRGFSEAQIFDYFENILVSKYVDYFAWTLGTWRTRYFAAPAGVQTPLCYKEAGFPSIRFFAS